ncbi:acyl-CoA N-acyltransferase [Umbelopsis sp. PMI_123]|nr:acyl-CoA N-acyltransferase [Umbelopsis sp. PMI_123]
MDSRFSLVPLRLEHKPQVVQLLIDYSAGLGISLFFQNFDKEVADFPGAYTDENRGSFYVVTENNGGIEKVVACIGLRPFKGFADTGMPDYDIGSPETTKVCEMKRLYVVPEYRKFKIGAALVDKVIEDGKARGYTSMVLDTLPNLVGATRLYERRGFKEMTGCIDNADLGRLYFELKF